MVVNPKSYQNIGKIWKGMHAGDQKPNESIACSVKPINARDGEQGDKASRHLKIVTYVLSSGSGCVSNQQKLGEKRC